MASFQNLAATPSFGDPVEIDAPMLPNDQHDFLKLAYECIQSQANNSEHADQVFRVGSPVCQRMVQFGQPNALLLAN